MGRSLAVLEKPMNRQACANTSIWPKTLALSVLHALSVHLLAPAKRDRHKHPPRPDTFFSDGDDGAVVEQHAFRLSRVAALSTRSRSLTSAPFVGIHDP